MTGFYRNDFISVFSVKHGVVITGKHYRFINGKGLFSVETFFNPNRIACSGRVDRLLYTGMSLVFASLNSFC